MSWFMSYKKSVVQWLRWHTRFYFFFHMFFSKKETNPNPTFNKPIKEFITLNDQLSTKNFPQGERFIINWAINKT